MMLCSTSGTWLIAPSAVTIWNHPTHPLKSTSGGTTIMRPDNISRMAPIESSNHTTWPTIRRHMWGLALLALPITTTLHTSRAWPNSSHMSYVFFWVHLAIVTSHPSCTPSGRIGMTNNWHNNAGLPFFAQHNDNGSIRTRFSTANSQTNKRFPTQWWSPTTIWSGQGKHLHSIIPLIGITTTMCSSTFHTRTSSNLLCPS